VDLYSCRCPAAIVGRIRTIIVNAINRQIIGVPVGKRPIPESFIVRPFDGNATAAITIKGRIGRIAASGKHICPDTVKTRSHAFSRIAMSEAIKLYPFRPKAAAGFDLTVSEPLTLRDMFVSAFATATPQRAIVRASGAFNNGQASKNPSCDIRDCGHVGFLQKRAGQVTEPVCEIGSVAHSGMDCG